MTKWALNLLMLLLLAVPLIPRGSTLQAGVGTMQGTVVREGTSEPIPDVEITIASRGANLTAVSDANGQFTVRNVPAGSQMVTAQRDGYFAPSKSAGNRITFLSPLAVIPNETTRIEIALVPGGSISGRVVDPAGKPLVDNAVHVLRKAYEGGMITLRPFDMKTTNDHGEFRFYRLEPADYFLVVIPQRPALGARSRIDASTGIPIPTFYPGSVDRSGAIAITLHPGDDVSGINVQVRTGPVFTVSGKVTSTFPLVPVTTARGVRQPVAVVTLIPRNAQGFLDPDGGTTVNVRSADDVFDFPDVAPGSYELIARLPVEFAKGWGGQNPPATATAPNAFGRASIEVRSGNVENVAIVVRYGNDLKGRLIVDGKPAAASVRISLQSTEPELRNAGDGPTSNTYNQIGRYQATIALDGSFTIPLLPEGRYTLQVAMDGSAGARGQASSDATLPALPFTAYVADIRQGGVRVYDDGIAIGAEAPNPIDVIVNTSGGSVEGIVSATDQKPYSGATVVLVPPEGRRQNIALYRTARSDVQGHFLMPGLPPGMYTLFAWESLPEAYQNAEFLARQTSHGIPVNVGASVRTNANLTVIREDAIGLQ